MMDRDSSNTQKVLTGISSQTIVTIALGVTEIVSFSFMSRLLSKNDFGYYAAITAIVTVFSSLSNAGIGSAVIQCKELTKRYVDNAFTLSLIFGGGVSLLLCLLSRFLADIIIDVSMTVPLMLMSFTLLLNNLSSINISIMLRNLDFFKVGFINLSALILTSIIAIFLAWKGFGYYAIICRAVLLSTFTCLLSWIYCKRKYKLRYDRKTYIQILNFSGWLMASGVFRNFSQQVDKLLLGRLLSVSSLGMYNRPKEFILQVSSKLNGIFDQALFPVLSSLQDEKEKLKAAFDNALYLMNVFSLLLTLFFFINSKLIIAFFFGKEWIQLTSLLQIMSLVFLFNTNGRLADCYLRSLGKTKQQFYFRIAETITSIISVVLCYKWNIIGVALGFVLSNSIIKLSKILYTSHLLFISPVKTIRQIINSWTYIILYIPFFIVIYFFFYDTWTFNVLLLFSFLIISFIFFIYLPSLIGKRYKYQVHSKVVNYLRNKILC